MADEKQNEELQIPIEWDYDKFKNSAEFRGIKRNKKGQFVPNNEQFRLLVKYEEIKLSEIDTSEVTDMSFLFGDTKLPTKNIGNPQRKDFSGINEWDTSRVTTFEGMFFLAIEFNEDISGWDTSNAKNFCAMFNSAMCFNQPIGKWNTSKATDISYMFSAARNFNQPLNGWDTSRVTNMRKMFSNASSFNQDINSWDISKVEHSEDMFVSAKNFNQRLEKWDDSNIYNTSPIKFQEIKHKNGKFLPNNKQLKLLIYYGHIYYGKVKLDEIDTSEVTDMSNLFSFRKSQDFSGISEWDTSKVETFEKMFYENTKFNEDISSWDTSSAKNFRGMFRGASQFNQPIGKWNTSNVTNMSFMFFGTKFNQNINDWNVSKVTDFSYMFSGMLGGRDKRFTDFNQPLDKWDVSSAENMSGMFRNAKKFEQDLSTWRDKLGKLQDMREMFSGVGEDDKDDKDNEDDTNTQSNKTKKPFYGIGKKALEKIKCLESWTVPNDCKVIETEFVLDGKEFKFKKIIEKIKSSRSGVLYEKLTNPEYIPQIRKLEKVLKTPKTRIASFDGLNIGISFLTDETWKNIKENPKENEEFKENTEFLEDRKWIPENIKEQFKVFLLTVDNKRGEIDKWDIAYCEVFGLCFKIERCKKEKGEKNEESRESISGDFHLIQGYKIEDFRDFGVIRESEFEEIDEDTSLCFTPRDIYIWHKSTDENDKQGQNNRVFDIVLNVIIAQAYYRKMIGFRDRARKSDENTRKETKELQECHRDVCKFDLKAYNSMPMETNVNDYKFLRAIWKKISDTYSVDETYKELKESIAQMSQLLTDYKRDRQSWWFSLAAVLIALVSLLVAVVSALPVVEKLLK